MNKLSLECLADLNNFRTAPELDNKKSKAFLKELSTHMINADWFTVGIMADNSRQAILVIRQIESYYGWPQMNISSCPKENGPVFLKANQATNAIHIRIEHGLGEGILISCQHDEEQKHTHTFGPLPLNFFAAEASTNETQIE